MIQMTWNKKGNVFVNLVSISLGVIIFILASPMLFDVISGVVGGFGSATAFFVKLSLWVIFLSLVALFFKIVGRGNQGVSI